MDPSEATTTIENFKLDKKSYHVSKCFDQYLANEDLSYYKLRKFVNNSVYFSDIYRCGKYLYHKSAGKVYEFSHDRISWIPEAPKEIVELSTRISYLVLMKSTLYEITLSSIEQSESMAKSIGLSIFNIQSTPKLSYAISVKQTDFATMNSSAEVTKTFDFTYQVRPYALLIANRLIIANTCVFSEEDNAWRPYVIKEYFFQSGNSLTYESSAPAIIYNLDTGTCTVIDGTVNFDAIIGKYIVMFMGDHFALVDVETCERRDREIFGSDVTVKSAKGMYTGLINQLVEPGEVDGTVQITKFDMDGNVKVGLYRLIEDKVYKPTSDECAKCYCNVDRSYANVPCGCRNYCNRCVLHIASKNESCAKCNAIVSSFLKVDL